MADSKKQDTDPAVLEIQEFFRSLGDGGALKIKLYRHHPTTGKPQYVGTFTSDVDEELVRDNYGGGSFQFRAYQYTDDGVVYRGARTVEIAGASRDLSSSQQEEEPEERRDRLRQQRDELAERLRTMTFEQRFNDFRREMTDLVRELRNPPAAAQQENPVRLAMELIQQLDARRPHIETPATDVPTLLEVLQMGLELGSQGGGGGGGGGSSAPWERALSRLEPVLAKLVGGGAPALPPAAANQPLQNPPEESQPVNLKQAFGRYVGWVKDLAQQGKNPEAYALVMEDELPDHWRHELDRFLSERTVGSALTEILGWYPELEPHRLWLQRFVETLAPVDDDDEDEGSGVILGTREKDVRDDSTGVDSPD